MMALDVRLADMRAMIAHAQAAQPHEACGLLAGQGQRVMQVLPVLNAAADPLHAFDMDAQALFAALKQIDAAGLALVGIYHSHPKTDPIPSDKDIVAARRNYPDAAHVIISLKHDQPRVQAWRIQPDEIDSIELVVGQQPPDDRSNEGLTRTQRYATLLAALLALVVMLSLSFTLLPPAPIITPMAH